MTDLGTTKTSKQYVPQELSKTEAPIPYSRDRCILNLAIPKIWRSYEMYL